MSALVRARAIPAGDSFPLISTSGGFPGEKKRSLIFGDAFNIAASRAGVEKGAGAGAAAAAEALAGRGVDGADGAIFGAVIVGEDIEAVWPCNEERQTWYGRRGRVRPWIEHTQRICWLRRLRKAQSRASVQ